MASKKSQEPGKGEEVKLPELSNVLVVPPRPIDEEHEKRIADYPRWREGMVEGDIFYDDAFRAWFKVYKTIEGDLQCYLHKYEDDTLAMTLVDGVPKPCNPDGTPQEPETIESVYARFRNALAMTWIPTRAMDALHILDCLIGLKSVEFAGSDPIPILELQVAESNRSVWGYADITGEDIERLQSTTEHIAERAILEKKSKKSKTTLSEHSLILHDRAATYPSLSRQLRFLISTHGWSLTALGELANVDPSILSRFINEEQAITIETMDRLAKIMMLRLVPTAGDKGIYWRAVVKDRRKKKT